MAIRSRSEETKEKPPSKVAAMVLDTLEEISETSPIPKLAKAAKLALQITKRVGSTIEKTKGDRFSFDLLAGEARAFVYLIFVAHQNVQKEDDSMYDFDKALAILGGLNEYVEECCTTERIKPHTELSFFFGNYHYRCALQIYLNHYKNYRATGNTIMTLVRLLVKWNWMEETLEPEMNDINRGDRTMNEMDFAWTSGIRVSRPNNINLKMVWRSS
ncbi:hypothetical protein F5887DRAFT_1042355 [Amanita rubescens]|nr:hypothetical protein F5887DRAFT_1042355 [Amanita rubescens]